MTTDVFSLTVLGGLCSVIIALIGAFFSLKNKEEQGKVKILEDKLLMIKEHNEQIQELKIEIIDRFKEVSSKLTEMGSWQTKFQIDLVSLAKDIESLNNELFNIKMLYNPAAHNYGKNLHRPKGNSQWEGEYNKS